jgi:hypothetical protein
VVKITAKLEATRMTTSARIGKQATVAEAVSMSFLLVDTT